MNANPGEMCIERDRTRELEGKSCFCSWSGGKDSCLALYRALDAGAQVRHLVNMRVETGERSRSHGLRTTVLQAQAERMDLPLCGESVSWSGYEQGFIRILRGLKDQGIETGIFGDIDLQEHLDWECRVCGEAGMTAALPLWQEEPMSLVCEFCEAGFETRIAAVRAESLSPDVLGKALTPDLTREFVDLGVDACGENGEFHTVVVNGPIFREPLDLVPGEQVFRDGYWFMDFTLSG